MLYRGTYYKVLNVDSLIKCFFSVVCFRCSFPSNDVCVDWHRKIERSIKPPRNIDELFAFVYYAWGCEEGGDEISSYLGLNGETNNVRDNFRFEVRLMVQISRGFEKSFRISLRTLDDYAVGNCAGSLEPERRGGGGN